jgi:hypothetical protein
MREVSSNLLQGGNLGSLKLKSATNETSMQEERPHCKPYVCVLQDL